MSKFGMKFLTVLFFLIAVTSYAEISKVKLSEREQFAAEVVSSDEEFLMDYIDCVPEDRLMEFFELSIKKAVEIAKLTLNMESDDEAYIFITEKINGKDGIKIQIENIVKEYLDRDNEDSNGVFSKRLDNRFVEMYVEHFIRFEQNIASVRLQKSVF
ncbi:MAG: hypothetical protein M0R46_16270 [Candidatus Muirbacterium halophilum]|nr:hypothetical protein [Candidatus Muirbacterium halophilum]MCK9477473.1 hypothetical protein [Candidatus Muirbacterium halophilum]